MKLSELQIESLIWWDDAKGDRILPEDYFACLLFSKFIACSVSDCTLTDTGCAALECVRTMTWEEIHEVYDLL